MYLSKPLFIVLLLTFVSMALSAQAATPPTTARVAPQVEAAFQQEETVRVIVALKPPEASTMAAMSFGIAQAQDDVLADIDAAEIEVVHEFEAIPGLAAEISLDALDELRNNPNVVAVDLDLPVRIALESSSDFIRATQIAQSFNLTGAGVNVAVLDTGIDSTHVDLADNLIGQHCFNRSTCLPDQTDESGSAEDEQGHGTHVAGIITNKGETAPKGIAPNANIIAVRVLNRFGSGWTSDVVKGIEWVVANQQKYNIRVMNLSLGGGAYEANCDNLNANTQLYATAVAAAREAGIVVFAASGNEGHPNRMMAPACVSGAVAVGNVHDTAINRYNWPNCSDTDVKVGQVTCSSNGSSELDLLAPGTNIISAGLGGGQVSQSGTSMATPHVSAVAALMLEADKTLTPDRIETILKQTGIPTVDSRTTRSTPRIDAFAALKEIAPIITSSSAISGTVVLQGRDSHEGVGIYVSEQSCDTATFTTPVATTDTTGRFEITAVPTPTTVVAAASNTTLPQVYQCLQVSAKQYLAGQYQTPRGTLGSITLLAGDINADNVIDILDIAAIAGDYGGDSAAFDLNQDGTVDIFDLSISAKNYQQKGPLTGWK